MNKRSGYRISLRRGVCIMARRWSENLEAQRVVKGLGGPPSSVVVVGPELPFKVRGILLNYLYQ